MLCASTGETKRTIWVAVIVRKSKELCLISKLKYFSTKHILQSFESFANSLVDDWNITAIDIFQNFCGVA